MAYPWNRWLWTVALCATGPLAAAAEFPSFAEQTIDENIGKVCYAVTTADVNGDGKPDVVAVSENRVQWYENPSWKKHVILENQTDPDNVCIAAHDIDGDGQVDFALGAGWTKIGTIQWITRQKDDPDAKWSVHFIGKELSTHRMTFADVLGKGKPQLVVSPLNPSVAGGARLLALEVPANPKTDRWQPTVLNESFHRLHGHSHGEWEQGLGTLTASQEGVHRILRKEGGFDSVRLVPGISGTTPETQGTGEIKIGHFGQKSRYFLAAVEPMHGTDVVVYTAGETADRPWKRVVLDNSFKQGHALVTADLDGDGNDEVIAGHREPTTGKLPSPGLYAYRANPKNPAEWTKHILDNGGCAVEDAFAADLDGDGRPDLVAGGRATHNVKIYWNRAK